MIRRFNRFELKYVLSIDKAAAIMQDLAGRTVHDEHGGSKGYAVESLYYDSPELDFFWDKIEGLKFRRKLRIRIYPGESPTGEGLVEIKQRINRTVQKRRLVLPLEEAYALCAGQAPQRALDPADESVASEALYLVQARQLQPTCMIAYHRKAFVGTAYDPGLRITFDTRLQCRIKGLRFDPEAVNRHFLPPDCCIMEVKVDEAVPDWVASLLQSHDCELQRVSKYCAGLALAKNIQVTHLAVSEKALSQQWPEPASLAAEPGLRQKFLYGS